jgi:polyhydroxybutyrate depolymerase
VVRTRTLRAVAPAVALLTACAPRDPGARSTAPRDPTDSAETDVDTADNGDDDSQVVDSADPSDAPPRTLGTGLHRITHDGRARAFFLYVPADLPLGAPLLFALHGYSDSAVNLRAYAGLDAVADREKFVVVYPQGTTDTYGYSFWEVGYAFHDGSVDDVGFLLALRELLVADHGLDAASVVATGMSNGGDMMYRLACEEPGAFAALAPVAGCLMGWLAVDCTPDPHVPLLEIHGTDDAITPWEGDPDGSDGYGPYLGTESSIGHFVAAYGLDTVDESLLPDVNPDGRTTVLAHAWSSDLSPAQVWLYEVQGGRHDWPTLAAGDDIESAEEIWAFARPFLDLP